MNRVLAIVLALLALSAPTLARDNWKVVGSVVFQDPFLEQIITIPPESGSMRAVRFDIKGSDVEIASIRLLMGNGQKLDVPVKLVFKANTSSRRIDLPGGVRNLRQITVVYRSHGPAQFDVVGDVVEQPGWVQLGCREVGFMVSQDVITADARDVSFTKLRLRVDRLPVEFFDVTVVYGNGQRQTLRVRSVIQAGQMTRDIAVSGVVRAIRGIELLYRSVPTQRQRAVVCADGWRVP